MKGKILVTGGAGYIGSHTSVDLLLNGYDVVIVDNYSNSKRSVIQSIKKISPDSNLVSIETDITNLDSLRLIFKKHRIESVIHFAAYKAVGESVKTPLSYYHNNINGLINVLRCCEEFGVNKLVFSSSCSVYGDTEKIPVTEETEFEVAASPYAYTKQIGETMINDFTRSNPDFKSFILRYFNPAGAHPSGMIGEDSSDKPNNLVPIITGVGSGEFGKLTVFGNDYPTPDGTCIRDYIHVCDLAEAHRISLEKIDRIKGVEILNVGVGAGVSVLEMISSFEEVTGKKLNYEIGSRRDGDIIGIYSDTAKSETILQWRPKMKLDDIMLTAWNWELNKKMKHIEYYITTTNSTSEELINETLSSLMDSDVDQKFSASLVGKIADEGTTHFTIKGTWHTYQVFLDLTKNHGFSIEHFEE